MRMLLLNMEWCHCHYYEWLHSNHLYPSCVSIQERQLSEANCVTTMLSHCESSVKYATKNPAGGSFMAHLIPSFFAHQQRADQLLRLLSDRSEAF